MIKFGKNYKLTVQMSDAEEAIIIEPPLTIKFDVTRNTSATANTMNLTIYNLAEGTRNRIFQDLFDLSSQRRVVLQAGYGSDLCTIFSGNLRKAYSRRQGTEILTECMCWDDGSGDVLNAFNNNTIASGASVRDLLTSCIDSMRNTVMGEIGSVDENPIPRGTSLIGNSFSLLSRHADGDVFIDNGQINILKSNEVVKGLILLIDSSTGLLGTPQRQDAKLIVDLVFEPRIKVAQVIEVNSSIQKEFNGQFKVLGLSHAGVISASTAGELRTTLQLLMPNILNNLPLNLVKDGKVTPLIYGVGENIRSVYGYLLKYGKPPDLKITSNINWTEVLVDYSQQGSAPTIEVLSNLSRTAKKIQAFLDTYYSGEKVIISSGWRSKAFNATAAVGGSSTSKHVLGLALDWFIVGIPMSEQHASVRKNMIGEVITYSWGQHYGLQANREIRNGDR